MKFKKTRWLIFFLTVAVIVAVAVNWKITGGFNKEPETTEDGAYVMSEKDDDYFDNARYTRLQSRDEAIGVLKSVVNNEKADSVSRLNASESINQYAVRSEQEVSIENQIRAKNFEDCIVFIGPDNATVVVKAQGLSGEEAAQILDIVASSTNLNANVIKIIEMK